MNIRKFIQRLIRHEIQPDNRMQTSTPPARVNYSELPHLKALANREEVRGWLEWFGDNAHLCRFPETQPGYLGLWDLVSASIFMYLRKQQEDPDKFLRWVRNQKHVDPEIKFVITQYVDNWRPKLRLTN